MQQQAVVDQTDEEHAKSEYETLIADAKAKDLVEKEALAQLESNRANLESGKVTAETELASKNTELYETHEYASQLLKKCSFLQENYDLRKEMRGAEAGSLTDAKHALQGGSGTIS